MKTRVLVLGVIGLMFIGLSSAQAQSPGISGATEPYQGEAHTVFSIPGDRQVACNLIDFEGYADQESILTVLGPPDVTFGPSWIALIDQDAGGSGNFANEPSPDTSTVYMAPEPINFSEGVQYVEFYYSAAESSIPVTLNAWDGPDATGTIVATAQGTTVGVNPPADCTGDPTGAYCLWAQLSVSSATNDILSVSIEGAVANYFGFDNMVFCTAQPETGACCLVDGGCEVTTEDNCLSIGGTYLGAGSVCLGDGNNDGIDDACQQERTIPVLSVWGLGLLVLLLLGGGIAVLLRR